MTAPIAITGAAVLSGLGLDPNAWLDRLSAGDTAVQPIAEFETRTTRAKSAGQIVGFDPSRYIPAAKLRRIDRVGRLAIAACRLALEDAGVMSGETGDRIGVAVGSHTAGIHSLVDYLDRLVAHGPPGASALDFSNTVGNAAASLCGIELGLRGVNVTLNNKEASGLAAVAYAASLLDNREGDSLAAIVAGGVDDLESTFFAIHDHFGVLARDDGDGEVSRPFDRRRNGFVMGAGAYLLVFETRESAQARRRVPLAHLAGIAGVSAPCRLNDWPRDSGAIVDGMRTALSRANASPSDVAVVFASANSTAALDRVEAEAIAAIFGPGGVPVVALKGALGECGAVGAAGLIAAAGCLRRGVIPPTAGWQEPDPACPVDVSNQTRRVAVRAGHVALVNSIASGGTAYFAVVAP